MLKLWKHKQTGNEYAAVPLSNGTEDSRYIRINSDGRPRIGVHHFQDFETFRVWDVKTLIGPNT